MTFDPGHGEHGDPRDLPDIDAARHAAADHVAEGYTAPPVTGADRRYGRVTTQDWSDHRRAQYGELVLRTCCGPPEAKCYNTCGGRLLIGAGFAVFIGVAIVSVLAATGSFNPSPVGPTVTDAVLKDQTPGQPIVIKIESHVTKGQFDIDWSTLSLIDMSLTGAAQNVATLAAAGEGIWTVDTAAKTITFTPAAGFTGAPSPVGWWIQDTMNVASNTAKIIVSLAGMPPVKVVIAPKAKDVTSSGFAGTAKPVTVKPDVTKGTDTVDYASVNLEGVMFLTYAPSNVTLAADKKSAIVDGQGAWSVDDKNNGEITFTPLKSFTGQADPVKYTIADVNKVRSDAALVVINPLIGELEKGIENLALTDDAKFWANYKSILVDAAPANPLGVVLAVTGDLIGATLKSLDKAGAGGQVRNAINADTSQAFAKARDKGLTDWQAKQFTLPALYAAADAYDDSNSGLKGVALGTRCFRLALIHAILLPYLLMTMT